MWVRVPPRAPIDAPCTLSLASQPRRGSSCRGDIVLDRTFMRERVEKAAVVDGERIADLLWEVNRLLRDRLLEHADAAELPRFRGRFRLLARVVAEPGVTVNELARRIQLPQSRVSVVAGEVE